MSIWNAVYKKHLTTQFRLEQTLYFLKQLMQLNWIINFVLTKKVSGKLEPVLFSIQLK